MNILDQIIAHKLKEVEERKTLWPTRILEKGILFERSTHSLKKGLLRSDQAGIIAEFKRQSPSKGVINQRASVEQVSTGYIEAGVTGLSILTDTKFFGGSNEDLTLARKYNPCPILRKDFVIDEYQIIEAKSIGADVILLIAAALTPEEVKNFTQVAHSLELEVLLEIHNEQEFLNNAQANIDLIGVNNRDLKTFEVSIETSKRLSSLIPDVMVKISESGIDDVKSILELRRFGFKGFLIGQAFMEQVNPEKACKTFVNELLQAQPG
ncbi:MAG TPA: indole-3-glycerol phosphate synthase TrpC [Cyclobacteriaceae bacterium]|nr:indole-3-glycerol phosphate synthase TrpC [Cyclobacteriaceae bacterium]